MTNSAFDGGIPLLTEILVTPPSAPKPAAPSVWTKAAIPITSPALRPPITRTESTVDLGVDFDIPELKLPIQADFASTVSAPPPEAEISAEKWHLLKAEITENITHHVLDRINFVLEQRVRDSLADVLQIAVEGLSQEIKHGLHHALEDVISQAVAQEIARLSIPKK